MRRLLHIAALLIAAPAGADMPLFDFEQPVFVERGYRVKDHALVRDGSDFHLFYIRGALEADVDPSLGHAVSADLRRWEPRAPVLPVQPGTFASRSIWAPQVLPVATLAALSPPHGVAWGMFFTGVNDAGSQAIGLAWSADLEHWQMEPEPVYTPGAWADWSAADWADCRDPFAFAVGDTLVLLATARRADGRGALAHALLTPGANAFADAGPLVTAPDAGALESPQLLRVDAAHWQLLLTRGGVYGTSALAAGAWRGPWSLESAEKIDNGAAPEVTAIAPELIAEIGLHEAPPPEVSVFSRHENYYEWGRYNFAIQFDLIHFHAEQRVVVGCQDPPGWLALPPLGGAFGYAPTFEDNPVARGAASPSGYAGHSWISSFEAYRSTTGGGGTVGDSLGAAATGRLVSPPFTVTGERLDFLIGGAGHPDSCWLELRLKPDGAPRFRAAPPGGPGTGVPGGEGLPLAPRAWDTRSLVGLEARLELVDRARGPGGFIALDHLVWSDADPALAEPPLAGGPARGFDLVAPPANPWTPPAGALALGLRVEAAGEYRVDCYSVDGRRAAPPLRRTLPRGLATLAPELAGLPSGLYLLRVSGPGGALVRKQLLLR